MPSLYYVNTAAFNMEKNIKDESERLKIGYENDPQYMELENKIREIRDQQYKIIGGYGARSREYNNSAELRDYSEEQTNLRFHDNKFFFIKNSLYSRHVETYQIKKWLDVLSSEDLRKLKKLLGSDRLDNGDVLIIETADGKQTIFVYIYATSPEHTTY